MRKKIFLIPIIVILSLLFGCNSSTPEQQDLRFTITPETGGNPEFIEPIAEDEQNAESGYPLGTPDQTDSTTEGYPAPVPVQSFSVDGRSATALQSYDLAYAVATDEFDSNSYLVAIMPSHIMLRNLGNPPVLPGWFYKFRKPDSRREFIVQVVDDIVTGTTLTESAVEPTQTEQPIDVSQLVIDTPEVLNKFKENNSDNGIWSEVIAYDFELVNLTGSSGLTWNVVDPITFERLYSIDAISGEVTENPYQQ